MSFRDESLTRIAEQLLADKGCQNFSTKELAEIAGVGKGTVYTHRPSQAAWVGDVLGEGADRVRANLPADETSGDPVQALREQVCFLVECVVSAAPGSLGVPCCLHHSPCPHAAWATVANALRQSLDRAMLHGALKPELSTGVILDAFQSLLVTANREAPGRRAEALRGVERVFLTQFLKMSSKQLE